MFLYTIAKESISMSACQKCGNQLSYIEQYSAWYCYTCEEYQEPQQAPTQPSMQTSGGIWNSDYYQIRKKVIAISGKYWIEDRQGNILGFSKQKLFKLKEDIRIYSDENMNYELFRIMQKQILDITGNFAVIDSQTNIQLGFVKRKGLKSTFIKDEWQIFNAANQLVGEISEGTGRGLARKYTGGIGKLIPEKVTLSIQGRPVAEIKQKFKIIGDIWEIDCRNIPQDFDRRVLLACIILMGLIERKHK